MGRGGGGGRGSDMSASTSTSDRAISEWPCPDASIRAVLPLLSAKSLSAPTSTSNRATMAA